MDPYSRWLAPPLAWTALGLALFPLALSVAPRLERPRPAPRLLVAPPLAPPPRPHSIRAPPVDLADPATFRWQGCRLIPAADPREGGVHVRTSARIGDLSGLATWAAAAGVRGVRLGAAPDPEDLAVLGRWRDLQYLSFDGDFLTDGSLVPLGRLTDLRMLEVGVRPYATNQVTDGGLSHLADLGALRYLGIHGFVGVRGPGLTYVADLPHLQQLELSYTDVADGSLVHLTGLSELKTLSLQHTRITDAGLVHLAALPSLHTLDLRQTAVTPDAAAILATYPALRRVVLHPRTQAAVIEAVRGQGLTADGAGWIPGTVGCGDWSSSG